jgi:transposase-like protein
MSEKRRNDTVACKRAAVRLSTDPGSGVAETARHWGINTTRLRRWQRQLHAAHNGALPGQGHLSAEPEELRPLRDANRRLRMERAMVTKAPAGCAQESR